MRTLIKFKQLAIGFLLGTFATSLSFVLFVIPPLMQERIYGYDTAKFEIAAKLVEHFGLRGEKIPQNRERETESRMVEIFSIKTTSVLKTEVDGIPTLYINR